jgi:hypothetical protein
MQLEQEKEAAAAQEAGLRSQLQEAKSGKALLKDQVHVPRLQCSAACR